MVLLCFKERHLLMACWGKEDTLIRVYAFCGVNMWFIFRGENVPKDRCCLW